jgi:microcystin degradation protein MlrC
VVGAGSTGGSTHILDALVRNADDLTVYLPLHDPKVLEELWSEPVGAHVSPTLCGTEGLQEQPQVVFDSTVVAKEETAFGKAIVLCRRGLHVAVTERPPYTVHPKFWRQLGLSVWKADAVVQKAFFHYRIFYAASNRKNIAIESRGPTSFEHVKTLELDMPTWPSQPVEDWRPFDAAHRAAHDRRLTAAS